MRRFARPVEIVERAALVEERRLAGVDVFRLAVGQQRPRPEGDDAAARIADGDGQPVAEEVDRLALPLRHDGEARLDDFRQRNPFLGQVLDQRRAPLGREAEAEAIDRAGVQLALGDIGPRRRAARSREALAEEALRQRHHVIERAAALLALALEGRFFRQRQPHLAGQPFHRLAEVQPLGLADELDRVAVRAAAEAVIEALLLVDAERGRLLRVERAQAHELAALAHELDPPPDHFGHAHARFQLVQEALVERHAPPLSLPSAAPSPPRSPWRSPWCPRTSPSARPSPCPCPSCRRPRFRR